jgi:hypothetical protein
MRALSRTFVRPNTYLDHVAHVSLRTSFGDKGRCAVHELANAAQRTKTELLVNGFGQQVTFKRIGQADGVICLHDDFLFWLGITPIIRENPKQCKQY